MPCAPAAAPQAPRPPPPGRPALRGDRVAPSPAAAVPGGWRPWGAPAPGWSGWRSPAAVRRPSCRRWSASRLAWLRRSQISRWMAQGRRWEHPLASPACSAGPPMQGGLHMDALLRAFACGSALGFIATQPSRLGIGTAPVPLGPAARSPLGLRWRLGEICNRPNYIVAQRHWVQRQCVAAAAAAAAAATRGLLSVPHPCALQVRRRRRRCGHGSGRRRHLLLSAPAAAEARGAAGRCRRLCRLPPGAQAW